MKSIPTRPKPSKPIATPLSLSRFLTLWHQRTGLRGDYRPPRKLFSPHQPSPISRKMSAVCSPRRGEG
jgi:hypothetical protein